MWGLIKHPLVDCDLEEAALWYAVRNRRVADRFITAAEEAIRSVSRSPLQHRVRFDGVRRVNLAGFPYAVFFQEMNDTIYIFAVLHAARDHRRMLEKRGTPNRPEL
jgi:plasmid stabilization system protein ParE